MENNPIKTDYDSQNRQFVLKKCKEIISRQTKLCVMFGVLAVICMFIAVTSFQSKGTRWTNVSHNIDFTSFDPYGKMDQYGYIDVVRIQELFSYTNSTTTTVNGRPVSSSFVTNTVYQVIDENQKTEYIKVIGDPTDLPDYMVHSSIDPMKKYSSVLAEANASSGIVSSPQRVYGRADIMPTLSDDSLAQLVYQANGKDYTSASKANQLIHNILNGQLLLSLTNDKIATEQIEVPYTETNPVLFVVMLIIMAFFVFLLVKRIKILHKLKIAYKGYKQNDVKLN